eukprot:3112494-Amphidinium_carterae.2
MHVPKTGSSDVPATLEKDAFKHIPSTTLAQRTNEFDSSSCLCSNGKGTLLELVRAQILIQDLRNGIFNLEHLNTRLAFPHLESRLQELCVSRSSNYPLEKAASGFQRKGITMPTM